VDGASGVPPSSVLWLRTRDLPSPVFSRKSKDQGGYQVKTDISDSQAEAVGDTRPQRRANAAVPSAS
jgi:hypothetical protein